MAIKDIITKKPILPLQTGPVEQQQEEQFGPPLPPPVEPEVYYPGYREEIKQYAATSLSSEERLSTITERRAQQQMQLSSQLGNVLSNSPIATAQDATNLQSIEYIKSRNKETEIAYKAYQDSMSSETQQLKSSEWKLHVLNLMPTLMLTEGFKGQRLNTATDMLNIVPNDLVTDEDKVWLQQTFDKLSYLKPKLPEGYDPSMTMDQVKQKLLSSIEASRSEAEKAKRPLRALSTMTIEEVAKYFAPQTEGEDSMAKLPEGITAEEFRQLLAYMEMPEEDKKAVDDFVLEAVNSWKLESERINLIRTGVLQAKSPNLVPADYIKMMLVQPGMATAELLDKMYTYTIRPAIAAGMLNFWGRVDTTEDDSKVDQLQTLYKKYQSEGHNTWEALGLAYNDWNLNWGIKMGLEIIFDPTTYIGLGLLAKGATKAGSIMVKAGQSSRLLERMGAVRIGTQLGPKITAFERGIADASDVAFKYMIKEPVLAPIKGGFYLAEKMLGQNAKYAIPKTTTAMAKEFAQQTMGEFTAVLQRMYPNNLKLNGLTELDITTALKQIMQRWIESPAEGGDMQVKLGAKLAEFLYLDKDAAAKMFNNVLKEIPDFDTIRLSRLNDELLNFLSGIYAPKVSAGAVLGAVGIKGFTEEQVDTLAKKLISFRQTLADDAVDKFVGKRPINKILNAMDSLKETRLKNLNSPITLHTRQAGRAATWISQASDRLLQSKFILNMESRVTMPFARWNLIFLNFGPANFFEGMWRGFLGGGDLVIPRDYGGVLEFGELTWGLENTAYEFRMMERGITEQAVSGKAAHTSAIGKDGVIAGITQPIVLGGVERGPTFSLFGENFKLSYLGAINDPWDYAVQLQKQQFNAKRYIARLRELDPDTMSGLDDVLSKHHTELDSMEFLDKSDYAGVERTAQEIMSTGYSERARLQASITTHQLTRNKIAKTVAQPLNEATSLYHPVKHEIKSKILDGSGLADIPKFEKDMIAMQRDMDIVSLKPPVDRMKSMIKQFEEAPVDTVDDFIEDLDFVATLERSTQVQSEYYRAMTAIRANQLMGTEKDKFYLGSAKVYNEYLETTADTLNKMINKLEMSGKKISSKAKGATPQITTFQNRIAQDINNIYRSMTENDATMMKKIYDIESKINKTPQKQRTARFWEQLRVEKDKVWTEGKMNRDAQRKLLLAKENDLLTALGREPYLPKKLSFATGKDIKLTLANIAELMGNTADDAMKMLDNWTTHIITNPKDSFIDMVQVQANRFAAKSEMTAEEIGFSKAAIGDVYDSMWRQMGLDPASIAPDEKVMQETKKIFDEIKRVYAAGKVSESDAQKWSAYWNGLADDMDTIPMFGGKKFITTNAASPDNKGYIRMTATKEGNSLGYVDFKLSLDPNGKPQFVDIAVTKVEDTAKRMGVGTQLNLEGPLKMAKDNNVGIAVDFASEEGVELAKSLESKGYVRWQQPPEKGQLFNRAEVIKVPEVSREGWQATRVSAMDKANQDMFLSFPTYGNDNIIDETMKTLFPFWSYEKFRWNYLPRTFMRTPGTLTSLAKYMDYSEGGYIPLPGIDLQINPLRGSVWMGGLRSFYLKDFPEYYDRFPGLEFFESLGRYGFYPGLPVQAATVLFGSEGKPGWSEFIPPWISSPLAALRQLEDFIAPNGSHPIGQLLDTVLPDRFREYKAMLTLGKWGYDADAIWRKMQAGEKVTPEEEKLWRKAEAASSGLMDIVMEQTGLLRYRPEKYDEMKTNLKLAIEEMTGVPVSVQEEIDKQYPTTGKRFADYYHLDILQQKLLYMNETFRNWQGVSDSLLPAGYKMMEVKIGKYYEDLDKLEQDIRHNGLYGADGTLKAYSIEDLNKQLVSGQISPKQWVEGRSNLVSKLAEQIETLANSEYYAGVPKTLDERKAYMEAQGTVVPTLAPDQELLNYYYELQPEMKMNPDTGLMELDFDTYYAYVDNLLASIDKPYRARLLQRIQLDWTGLEKLYSKISKDFFRPYNQVRDVVLSTYRDKDLYWLDQYIRGDTAERNKIQEFTLPTGKKLVSDYTTKLSDAHSAMREADPELDAWLNFFGKVDSFKTTESERIFNDLKKQYLTESMVK